ncbi:MAG: efflux RND transporter permease subunit [Planctomycetes bacterium]|nr:efflux RND transporter permease subunit [Planctomycetota bacterium]
MFRNIVLFLIRHRTSVLVLAAVWAVGGVWVMMHTPMDAVPDLSENQVLVSADWPGQNPPEIERRITRPLALALQGLPGVKTVRGSSDVGSALLHLIFENSVSFLEARRRVADGLAALDVQFPAGVHPRLAADGIPTGQIFWYTVEGTGMDLAELRSLQDTVVVPQLRSVAGVAEVASVGGFIAEYQIEVDVERMTSAGITLSDLESALAAITQPASGQIVHSANSEMLVRRVVPTPTPKPSSQADGDDPTLDPVQSLAHSVLPLPDGRGVRLDQIARVTVGPAPRRGVFEKDGNEAVAGIVHLRYGHNPLTVTRDVRRRLQQIGDSLPRGVRLVPCYDRTPLILSAVETVTRTLLESLLVTSICVVLILRHWRTSLVIVSTLPLVVLGSFLGMAALRVLGVADVQTNIMSLAGIVVSIGVLVDSSIVVAENVTHQLRRRFGDEPIQGDVSQTVADACATVGVPAILSMLMMLVSFLPVFALQGIDGQMYRPLAWTKTLALMSAAVLTVTLVPVLCATLIRGRVRDESASAIVRSVVNVYRPVLAYLIDRPAPLALLLCATLIAGAAATGVDVLVRLCAVAAVGITWWLVSGGWRKGFLTVAVIAATLALQSSMRPIGLALRLPLDEGMVMDMPITVPRISVLQAVDDLKARNMVLCRFPEVVMVTGKGGRADTPFDPAPLDMIESMVEFRPRSRWPSRRILRKDAVLSATQAVTALKQSQLIEPPANAAALVSEIVDAGLIRFDAIQREVCWQRLQSFQVELSRELAQQLATAFTRRLSRAGALTQPLSNHDMTSLSQQLSPADVRRLGQQLDVSTVHVLVAELRKQLHQRGWLKPESVVENRLLSGPTTCGNLGRALLGLDAVTLDEDLIDELELTTNRRWSQFERELNDELRQRAAATWIQIVMSEVFSRQPILDDSFAEVWNQILAARYGVNQAPAHQHDGSHATMPSTSPLPVIDPHRKYDTLVQSLSRDFARQLWLWPHDVQSLNQAGGEMDLAVQMPGWANVWTRPIQNRVDMLATGVNSEVGVRVLGQDLDAVVQASDAIAEALRDVPGAADVVADPIRGKGYVTVLPDTAEAAELGVSMPDLDLAISTAISGHVIGHLDVGPGTRPIRLKVQGHGDGPAESLADLPIPRRRTVASGAPAMTGRAPVETVPLEQVAQIRMADGPATIKSENGWLRNYVRLNVRDRDPGEFVAAAQKHVLQAVHLPPGVFVEWTGQFEHAAQTRRVMLWMAPVAVGLILLILYAAFRDLADAGLMLLSVPGALAGGAVCQWLLGFPFSVAVGIGYIACFGMAAATSMVMLVYLREAVEDAGGLQQVSLAELRNAVMIGAVHRLRPKLLTEATTILSLAPMLWSSGMGADVIRPMAAPVLGGILIADEVVDLLLPIAFYAIRRRRWLRLSGVKPNGTVSQ